MRKKALEKTKDNTNPEDGVFIAHDAAYENEVDLDPIFKLLNLDCLSCRMHLTTPFELGQIM